ncbi:MAG TPA: hypothetical protein VN787_00975 [Steroidobacteraceae bacterium]|nr:hypothetical protein [Steroidobacteraceae bacterium]
MPWLAGGRPIEQHGGRTSSHELRTVLVRGAVGIVIGARTMGPLCAVKSCLAALKGSLGRPRPRPTLFSLPAAVRPCLQSMKPLGGS